LPRYAESIACHRVQEKLDFVAIRTHPEWPLFLKAHSAEQSIDLRFSEGSSVPKSSRRLSEEKQRSPVIQPQQEAQRDLRH